MRDLLFGAKAHDAPTDAGLLVIRIVAGLSLVLFHGLGKVPPSDGFVGMVGGMGMPAPGLVAWLGAFAEAGGGILLALGLLTRPVAFVVTVHFFIVTLMAHAGDPLGERELPLIFLSWAILLLLAGPGRFSLDRVLGRHPRSAI